MTEAHCIDLEQRQFPQANSGAGAPRILCNALCAAQIRITEFVVFYSVVELLKFTPSLTQ